jgi:hypothetical protein
MATCTAPGHPTCTITCTNGCIAWYTEPNGPCHTQCSHKIEQISVPKDSKLSLSVQDLPAAQLGVIFGSVFSSSFKSASEKSTKRVSYTVSSATLAEIEKSLSSLL